MTKHKLHRLITFYILAAILTIAVAMLWIRHYTSSYVPVASIEFPISNSARGIYVYPLACDFSPNDRYLATVDSKDLLKIWRVPDLKLLASHKMLDANNRYSLAWLPNGQDVALLSGVTVQTCTPAPSNNPALSSKTPQYFQHTGTPDTPGTETINPSGQYLGATGKISPSGQYLAVGWEEGALQIYDEATLASKVLSHPQPYTVSHAGYVLCGFAFSPDSSMIAACYFYSPDYRNATIYSTSTAPAQMRLYDVRTGKLKQSWTTSQSTPNGSSDDLPVAISQDNAYVAYGDYNGATVYNVASGKKLSLPRPFHPFYQISFICNTPWIATDGNDDGIDIVNYKTGSLIHTFHESLTHQYFTVSTTGRYIASVYITNTGSLTVNLWDLRDI